MKKVIRRANGRLGSLRFRYVGYDGFIHINRFRLVSEDRNFNVGI